MRAWVRENVGTKGEDAILWGKWDEGELEEEKMEEECPKPNWSDKQMRRRGEPPRKKLRRSPEEEGEGRESKERDEATKEGEDNEV